MDQVHHRDMASLHSQPMKHLTLIQLLSTPIGSRRFSKRNILAPSKTFALYNAPSLR
jgi:hypothetical protein